MPGIPFWIGNALQQGANVGRMASGHTYSKAGVDNTKIAC